MAALSLLWSKQVGPDKLMERPRPSVRPSVGSAAISNVITPTTVKFDEPVGIWSIARSDSPRGLHRPYLK